MLPLANLPNEFAQLDLHTLSRLLLLCQRLTPTILESLGRIQVQGVQGTSRGEPLPLPSEALSIIQQAASLSVPDIQNIWALQGAYTKAIWPALPNQNSCFNPRLDDRLLMSGSFGKLRSLETI